MVKEGYKFCQEEVKLKHLKMELCFEHFFQNCEKNFDIEKFSLLIIKIMIIVQTSSLYQRISSVSAFEKHQRVNYLSHELDLV